MHNINWGGKVLQATTQNIYNITAVFAVRRKKHTNSKHYNELHAHRNKQIKRQINPTTPTKDQDQCRRKTRFKARSIRRERSRTYRIPLRVDITVAQKRLIVVYVLRPVATVLSEADLQPRLHVSVVVYDCGPFDLLVVYVRIVAEAEHVPRTIQGERVVPECN